MSQIIPDTCIWVDFIHQNDTHLNELLLADRVIVMDSIVGELAVGNLSQRDKTLEFLHELDHIDEPSFHSTLAFIEDNQLFGIGQSWVDTIVLHAAQMAGVALWTRDKRVASVAKALGFAHDLS